MSLICKTLKYVTFTAATSALVLFPKNYDQKDLLTDTIERLKDATFAEYRLHTLEKIAHELIKSSDGLEMENDVAKKYHKKLQIAQEDLKNKKTSLYSEPNVVNLGSQNNPRDSEEIKIDFRELGYLYFKEKNDDNDHSICFGKIDPENTGPRTTSVGINNTTVTLDFNLISYKEIIPFHSPIGLNYEAWTVGSTIYHNQTETKKEIEKRKITDTLRSNYEEDYEARKNALIFCHESVHLFYNQKNISIPPFLEERQAIKYTKWCTENKFGNNEGTILEEQALLHKF